MAKKDAKVRLIQWILLLLEFGLKILDMKGEENVVADHLFRIPNASIEIILIMKIFQMNTSSSCVKSPGMQIL